MEGRSAHRATDSGSSRASSTGVPNRSSRFSFLPRSRSNPQLGDHRHSQQASSASSAGSISPTLPFSNPVRPNPQVPSLTSRSAPSLAAKAPSPIEEEVLLPSELSGQRPILTSAFPDSPERTQATAKKSKMSFFSKKRKDTAPTTMAGSPPLAPVAGLPSGPPSGPSLTSPNSFQPNYSGPPNPIASYSRAPPSRVDTTLANGPSTTASVSQAPVAPQPPSAPTPAATNVSYPWSQRPLNLLPPSPAPLPPPELLDPTKPAPVPSSLGTGPSPSPFPRYGHSVNPLASSSSGDLYIFGGLVNDQVKNDLYVLQCPPNAATSVGGGPPGSVSVALVETRGEVPGPRVGHASVGVGNVLIVWGGDTKTSLTDPQDDGLYLLNLSPSGPMLSLLLFWLMIAPRYERMDSGRYHRSCP